MLKYNNNRAQFWLFALLYFFVMCDLLITSIGLDRGIGEASPFLSVYITHSGSGILDGLALVFGGLIATGFAVCLAFLASKIQRIFSFEFFVSALIIFHFMGILNWLSIL